MKMPDTFAGGTFDLPLTVAKLVRLAEGTTGPERDTARRHLWKRGWFLDRANIVWKVNETPPIARDSLFFELTRGES